MGSDEKKLLKSICKKLAVKKIDDLDEKGMKKAIAAKLDDDTKPEPLTKDEVGVLKEMGYEIEITEGKKDKKKASKSSSASKSGSKSASASASKSGSKSASKSGSKSASASASASAEEDEKKAGKKGGKAAKSKKSKESGSKSASKSAKSSASKSKSSKSGSKSSKSGSADEDEKKGDKKDGDSGRGKGKEWFQKFWAEHEKYARKKLIAAYVEEFGEKGKFTCENYISSAKKEKDLLGFKLTEEKDGDGKAILKKKSK